MSLQAHLAHPLLNVCSAQRKSEVEIVEKNIYPLRGVPGVAHSPERPFLLPGRGFFLLVVVSPPSPRATQRVICVRARVRVCVTLLYVILSVKYYLNMLHLFLYA